MAQKTVKEIALALGLSESFVYRQIRKGIQPKDMKPNSGLYSSPHLIEYNGKIQTITAWGKELGIGHAVIRGRIKEGMTMDRVLSPEIKREKKHLFRGELKTAQEIADILGKNRLVIYRFIRLGKPLE